MVPNPGGKLLGPSAKIAPFLSSYDRGVFVCGGGSSWHCYIWLRLGIYDSELLYRIGSFHSSQCV